MHVATWFPLGQQWTHLLPAWWATCLGCYLPGELPAWVLPACCTTCLPNQTRSNKTVLTQKPDLQSTRNRKTPNFIFLIFFWFFFWLLTFFSRQLWISLWRLACVSSHYACASKQRSARIHQKHVGFCGKSIEFYYRLLRISGKILKRKKDQNDLSFVVI